MDGREGPCRLRADRARRAGAWRCALVAGPFEPTQDVTADQLHAAWRAGKISFVLPPQTHHPPGQGRPGAPLARQ